MAFAAARESSQVVRIVAGFRTGRAFLAYRKHAGTKRSPMPDFYVGAHAIIGSLALRTRDAARYRTYFPALNIIAPA